MWAAGPPPGGRGWWCSWESVLHKDDPETQKLSGAPGLSTGWVLDLEVSANLVTKSRGETTQARSLDTELSLLTSVSSFLMGRPWSQYENPLIQEMKAFRWNYLNRLCIWMIIQGSAFLRHCLHRLGNVICYEKNAPFIHNRVMAEFWK